MRFACNRSQLRSVLFESALINYKSLFLQAETLVDHIKFDHGYTAKSLAIVNVLSLPLNFPTLNLRFSSLFFILFLRIVTIFILFLVIIFLVAGDYGRIHPRTTASLLSVCYWCASAPTWWSGSAEPKIDNCEEGIELRHCHQGPNSTSLSFCIVHFVCSVCLDTAFFNNW